MMSFLLSARYLLGPLEKFESGVNYVLKMSKTVGLPIAGIAIVLTVIMIFFGSGKDSSAAIRKLILICVGVCIIANIGWVVGFFGWVGEQLFASDNGTYEKAFEAGTGALISLF